MTTTQWIKAKMTPLQEQLDAIKDGKDAKAAAKLRKPIQKQIDKLWAMQRGQRNWKGER